MAYNANILLGRISKVHGYEGAVTVKLEKTFIENIPYMESVFLEIEGKPVPFFIDESEYPGSDILRLKFEGYGTFEKVNEFTGCRVFLTTGEKEHTSAGVMSFQNYKVILPDNNLVGTISDIIENPGQWLLNISTPDKKEILIPFHEDLIRSIDKRKKVIIMDLPEGLLEIN
ncbi:MAG: ribosome maturation factor RimM [Bacteroidia bacterium]|nr:ribosome maturation factor RimM [Bacteroidia bacterium]